MPKLGEMAQLARPFQIALVAVLALAMMVLAWFTLLHRSSTEPTASSSPPSAASSAANATASSSTASSSAGSSGGAAAAAGSGHVYHGPVPGLEGLTRDIKRAHEAAAKEERGVREPQSAAANETATHALAPSTATHTVTHRTTTRVVPGTTAAHRTATPHRSATRQVVHNTTSHASTSAASSATRTTTVHTQSTRRVQGAPATAAAPSSSTPTMQAVVASELKQGKVVLVLFWNPHSTDDIAVEGQVKAVAHTLGRHVAVHTAYASQVNSFGSITREIQVYQTPTLMIVNPHGQVTTLTGYTDAYAIEQAVAEASKTSK